VTFEQATIEDLDIPAQSLDAVLGLNIQQWTAHRYNSSTPNDRSA
jgi:hypothetical protein